MKTRLPAALGLIAAILLGLVWGAAPASAHTAKVSSTCETLTVDLKNYNGSKANSVKVWIDDQVVAEVADFDKSYTKTFALGDKYKAHTWLVEVVAWDDTSGNRGYTFKKSGASTPCERPVVPNNPQVDLDQVCGEITFTFSNDVELGDGTAADATWVLDGQTVTVKANAPHVVKTFTFDEDATDATVTLDGKAYQVQTDCEPNEVGPNPQYTVTQDCGSITFTFTNDVELGDNEFAPDATWVLDGQTVTVPANAQPVVKTFTFDEDASDATVTLDGETYTVETDCEPNVVPNNPAATVAADCGVATVTLTNDVATGEHEVVGSEPAVFEVFVDGELDETVEVAPNAPAVVIEYLFDEDSGVHTVQVGDGEVVEVTTDCTAPPTEETPTSTPPTQPEVAVLSQTATAPAAAPKALAKTGGDLTLLVAAGLGTLLAGTALLAVSRRRGAQPVGDDS